MRPRFTYGMLTCSPNLVADVNQIQRLAIRLVTGFRHLSYEERLQQLDLHSMKRRGVWVYPSYTFKVFTGLLDVGPNLLVNFSYSVRPEGISLQDTP